MVMCMGFEESDHFDFAVLQACFTGIEIDKVELYPIYEISCEMSPVFSRLSLWPSVPQRTKANTLV